MLHILLAPAPQPVEDVLLAKLHGDHQTVRHALGTGIVVLDVRDIAHRVANLEVNLIGTAEHIVEYLPEFGVDVGLRVAHLDKEVTVLVGLESALRPGRQCHRLDGQHGHECHQNRFLHIRYVGFKFFLLLLTPEPRGEAVDPPDGDAEPAIGAHLLAAEAEDEVAVGVLAEGQSHVDETDVVVA